MLKQNGGGRLRQWGSPDIAGLPKSGNGGDIGVGNQKSLEESDQRPQLTAPEQTGIRWQEWEAEKGSDLGATIEREEDLPSTVRCSWTPACRGKKLAQLEWSPPQGTGSLGQSKLQLKKVKVHSEEGRLQESPDVGPSSRVQWKDLEDGEG